MSRFTQPVLVERMLHAAKVHDEKNLLIHIQYNETLPIETTEEQIPPISSPTAVLLFKVLRYLWRPFVWKFKATKKRFGGFIQLNEREFDTVKGGTR